MMLIFLCLGQEVQKNFRFVVPTFEATYAQRPIKRFHSTSSSAKLHCIIGNRYVILQLLPSWAWTLEQLFRPRSAGVRNFCF